MKKFLLPFFVILIFTFYVLFARNSEQSIVPPINPPVANNNQEPSLFSAPPPSKVTPSESPPSIEPTPKTSPPPAPKPVAKTYKDGAYTGSVADAYYGNIQVRAIIQNGKIIDVQFLQYPDRPGHTSEVSSRSLPVLKQEAIRAQSAGVDIVSGATQTSEGFQQTLADALAQAKA